MLSDQRTLPARLQSNTAHDQRSKSHLQIAGQLIQKSISKSLTLLVAGPETRDQFSISCLACSAASAPRMLLATNGLLYCRRSSSGLLSISRLNFSTSSGNFLIAG
nr:hypothetical protein Iba_chr02cCG4110 [Ipomoea batatas]